MKIPKRPVPNVIRAQKEPSEEQRAAQQSVQLTAFGVGLALFILGFVAGAELVLYKLGGN